MALPLPAYALITRPSDLEKLVDLLRHEPAIAVDTESNSLYAYQEQVCLVQFSTPQADYMVDTLVLVDQAPLAEMFRNPAVEKVFHAAEYDLLCLKRDYGFEFAGLFDTMMAARILGRVEVGLGTLLEAEFGVQLNKRYQRANWGARPLPEDLLDYARLDTHYLLPLRERLKAELEARQLWTLAQEDFTRLARRSFSLHGNGSARMAAEPERNGVLPTADNPWRVRGVYDLAPQQVAILAELCRYRDQVAQSLNRPLFKVISNATLLAIAQTEPQNLKALAQIPGMTPPQMRRHGARLLEAVRRGQKAKPLYPPRQPRPNERYLDRLEALREWRKMAGRKMGVGSDVILPRDLMVDLAARDPRGMNEMAEVMNETPWRLERFGTHILELLNERRGES